MTQDELRFRELAKRWKQDTAHLSNTSAIVEHPAYREIVSMGKMAIPWMLNDLKTKPDHWFFALRELTGENPVTSDIAGRIHAMADAWVKWGEERGII